MQRRRTDGNDIVCEFFVSLLFVVVIVCFCVQCHWRNRHSGRSHPLSIYPKGLDENFVNVLSTRSWMVYCSFNCQCTVYSIVHSSAQSTVGVLYA